MLRIVAAEEIVSVEIPDPVIYVMSPPAVEGMHRPGSEALDSGRSEQQGAVI